MKFKAKREALVEPLQAIQGVVERRQTVPILGNVLMRLEDGVLGLTATDMEVELVTRLEVEEREGGEVTVPARKFAEICRALPGEAEVEFEESGGRATVRSGRSRFVLATLPGADYPSADEVREGVTVRVKCGELRQVVELTQFAMAHQDVRYYLNGLLVEAGEGKVRAVATDGHRLAMAEMGLEEVFGGGEERQIIVPRKGVGELMRMLGGEEGDVELVLGRNAVQASVGAKRFTSKLIDGRFPDYSGVVPDKARCDKEASVDREELRQSLQRVGILSNEKYRAVRLSFDGTGLRVTASNPEQEEAEEEVGVSYEGDPLEIGFNVSYLVEAMGAVPGERVKLYLSDAGGSCLIQPEGREDCQYVVMPMRL